LSREKWSLVCAGARQCHCDGGHGVQGRSDLKVVVSTISSGFLDGPPLLIPRNIA
jgi:hypothetical protein